jgi:hypothetical protein
MMFTSYLLSQILKKVLDFHIINLEAFNFLYSPILKSIFGNMCLM